MTTVEKDSNELTERNPKWVDDLFDAAESAGWSDDDRTGDAEEKIAEFFNVDAGLKFEIVPKDGGDAELRITGVDCANRLNNMLGGRPLCVTQSVKQSFRTGERYEYLHDYLDWVRPVYTADELKKIKRDADARDAANKKRILAEWDAAPEADTIKRKRTGESNKETRSELNNVVPINRNKEAPRKPEELLLYQFIPMTEFVGELKEREFYIEDLIPKDASFGAIYGESGCGKSFLVTDMLFAIHRGVAQWGGRHVEQARCAYVCAEGQHDATFRARAYAKKHGVDLADLPPVMAVAPNLADSKVAAAVLTNARKLAVQILVIDTLSATLIGDENSGVDMGAYVRNCQDIARQANCLVILIHHSGKDASKGARGWSGLRAALDLEVNVTRDGESRVAKITKSKGGADGGVFAFCLKPVVLGQDKRGKDFGSMVLEHCALPDKDRSKPLPAAGSDSRTVYDAAMTLFEENDGEVDLTDVLDVVVPQMKPPKVGKNDTRKDNARKYVMRLAKAGWFHYDDERLYRTAAVKASEDLFSD